MLIGGQPVLGVTIARAVGVDPLPPALGATTCAA